MKLVILFVLLPVSLAFSQNGMNMPVDSNSAAVMTHDSMTSSLSPNLAMNRDGSGTSWQPDNNAVNAYLLQLGKWDLMFHGDFFFGLNAQNFNNKGKRGSSTMYDVQSMFMGMAQHKVGYGGIVAFSTMLSIDPLFMGGEGYPLVFQTGESWQNHPLMDRQHPHDLIGSLTASYAQRINRNMDAYLYIGYPGEPALGPPNYLHRLSAFNNPYAPISHHWQDATHITFGVATVGFRYKIAKLEGSIFTGREPDENRYDFDKPTFDSYSYRLSVNPCKSIAAEFSQGFIHSPEALNPGEDLIRSVASIIQTVTISDHSFVSTSLVYGVNTPVHDSGSVSEHSLLIETNYKMNRLSPYARAEMVEKSTKELNLENFENQVFSLNDVTLGMSYLFGKFSKPQVSIGGQFTLSVSPNELMDVYGDTPLAAEIYVKLNPPELRMGNKEEMSEMKAK